MNATNTPQRHVCALYADISGSKQLFDRLNEAEAMQAFERCFNRMERAISSFNGRVVKHIGDQLMAVFDTAEDAMRAVPMGLREGSYAMGATRYQTAVKVVVPAALSGIASAYILGISRAVGETMILAVAAGMQPTLTFNPMEPAATITSYIVQVALGDLPHGSVGYQTIFAAGLMLLLLTLAFNMLGYWIRRKYREVY